MIDNPFDKDEFTRLIGGIPLGSEINYGWERWVCEPIITSPLAPRQAKAALEIIGFLSSHGINIDEVLYDIAKHEFHRLKMKENLKQSKPKLAKRKIR